jgi:hypothetical protein
MLPCKIAFLPPRYNPLQLQVADDFRLGYSMGRASAPDDPRLKPALAGFYMVVELGAPQTVLLHISYEMLA